MTRLTTRSVDYLELRGNDFWKEALLLSFSNALCFSFECHRPGSILLNYIQGCADILITRHHTEKNLDG